MSFNVWSSYKEVSNLERLFYRMIKEERLREGICWYVIYIWGLFDDGLFEEMIFNLGVKGKIEISWWKMRVVK